MWYHSVRICWKKECCKPLLWARGHLRETVCVIYYFTDEIIFCWNYYRYKFLKSGTANKTIISQIYIYIRNKNKSYNSFVIYFKYCHYMPCYRAFPFPDLKWFLAIGVWHFHNAPFNHFKIMFNISTNLSFFDSTISKECSSPISQPFTQKSN